MLKLFGGIIWLDLDIFEDVAVWKFSVLFQENQCSDYKPIGYDKAYQVRLFHENFDLQ